MVSTLHLKGASSGLRKETAGLAKPDKQTRINLAKASVKAMKIFYTKFYARKYPPVVTWVILMAVTLKGWGRILKHQLS